MATTTTFEYIGPTGPVLQSPKSDIEGTFDYIGPAGPVLGIEEGAAPVGGFFAGRYYHSMIARTR